MVPVDFVTTEPEKALELVLRLVEMGVIGSTNYFLGGATNDVAAGDTSIHPGARKTVSCQLFATTAACLRPLSWGALTSFARPQWPRCPTAPRFN